MDEGLEYIIYYLVTSTGTGRRISAAGGLSFWFLCCVFRIVVPRQFALIERDDELWNLDVGLCTPD